jgi:hypothetical protein
MTLRSTPDDVLACLATNGIDEDGIFAHEWLRMLERYDLAELVVLICKHRKNPAFVPLVDFLIACIEAEQGEFK